MTVVVCVHVCQSEREEVVLCLFAASPTNCLFLVAVSSLQIPRARVSYSPCICISCVLQHAYHSISVTTEA